MRYELVTDDPAETTALRSQPAVRPLLDPFLPALQSRVLVVAAKLGIFEALGQEACTAGELARKLSLDADALAMLLRVLVCAGYLSRAGEEYGLTALSSRTLLSRAQAGLCWWAKFNSAHWDMLSRLEDVVRTGKNVDPRQFLKSGQDWAVQQKAMLETARPAATWVAHHVPIRNGARLILDLGGSHGLYGAMICRRHPPMRSVVLELPEAVPHARALADHEGIADVVTHQSGDVLIHDLTSMAPDAVFLGNLVHHFTIRRNQDLLVRIKASLKHGGTVAVWDLRYPEPDAEPSLISDGFALLFRITAATRCYRPSEVAGWMTAAGLVDVQIREPPASTHVLVTARKP